MDFSSPSFPTRSSAALIAGYGAGTLAAQVLILRELLVLAHGQELKLALGLWSWLLWTGVGSLLGGRLARNRVLGPGQLGVLLFLLGWLLPGTILAIRTSPLWFSLPGGQSLPPGAALLLFLTVLAPFCLLSGCFFPWACQVLAPTSGHREIGRVYYWETLGAAAGVVLLHFVCLGRFSNLTLALAGGWLMACLACLVGKPRNFSPALGGWIGLTVLAAALFTAPDLDRWSRGRQWPERVVAATADTPYALLTATREAEQVSFFANHLWLFTYPDPASAERAVHPGLLMHPQPRQVLLLGGGVAGLIPEVLKHPDIARLDCVELDPQMVELAKSLLPPEAGLLPDPRVRFVYQDARYFLAQPGKGYDVILLNLPEPTTAQLNRFYTREFFLLASRRLAPRGVFSFTLTGGETSLNPLRAAYLGLAHNTLRQAFPEVLAWPGERVRFFGAGAAGVLTPDPEQLLARLAHRGLSLRFIREYYLLADLAPGRQRYLQTLLASQPPEINTDFNPRCYFYDLALSSAQEGLPLHRVLLGLQRLPAWLLASGFLAIFLLPALWSRRRPGSPCLYQVFIMGLGAMALEILLLILYQIFLGSLYRELGLLIAAFMAGMAAGSAWGLTVSSPAVRLGARLLGAQLGMALLALLLGVGLSFTAGLPWSPGAGVIQVGFLVILILAGFGGGAIFALSAGWWSRMRPGGGGGGALYAMDLLGATFGALGVVLLVLPVWGMTASLILVAALHAGAALTLVATRPS